MRRRSFLQMLGAALGLGLAPLATPTRALAQTISGLLYSDSEGTDPALLSALDDGITTSGGVEYAA